MAKTSISLVAIQKPTANSPVIQRRNKFTASVEQQILKIASFREGRRISKEAFWVDGSGSIYFALRYGRTPLELDKGKSTLKASSWEDLLDQLEQVKIIAIAGGLDDPLAAAANSVRANFK